MEVLKTINLTKTSNNKFNIFFQEIKKKFVMKVENLVFTLGLER